MAFDMSTLLGRAGTWAAENQMPLLRFGAGMLAGNVGQTGREAFSNALQGGMAGWDQAKMAELMKLRQQQQQMEYQQKLAEAQAQQAQTARLTEFMTSQGIPAEVVTPQLAQEWAKSQFLPPTPPTIAKEADWWINASPEQRAAVAQMAQVNPRGTNVQVGGPTFKLLPSIPAPPTGTVYINAEGKPATSNEEIAGLGVMKGGPADPKASQQYRERRESLTRGRENLGRYAELVTEAGATGGLVPSDKRDKLKAAYVPATKAVLDLFGAQAPQAAEMEFANRAMSDATSYRDYVARFGRSPIVGVQEIMGAVDRAIANLEAEYAPSAPIYQQGGFGGQQLPPPVPQVPQMPQAPQAPQIAAPAGENPWDRKW